MKEFIKKILKESLNEIIKGGVYNAFHGSVGKIDNFTDDFVGGKDALDQEGPGIYFTTTSQDAQHYGKFIYSVELKPRKLLTSKNIKVNPNILYKLIKSAPNWKETAQNFDYNPEKGVKMAISGAIDYNDNEKDIFLQIWIDFYRDHPVEFVRNMVKLGYDGIIVDRDSAQHIIVYNPSIINVKSSEVLNEDLIGEEYPSSFSMEHFKTLKSFKSRIQYCQDNLKRISSGSSRIVYMIDDTKVLKLAKNEKGLAQNEIEISYSNYHDISDITAIVFDYHQDNLWSEMELARKLSPSDFQRITGFKWLDYVSAINNQGIRANQEKQEPLELDKDIEAQMWENEFTYDMLSFIGDYSIPTGDLKRLSSYGIVKRKGVDTIVMIDYGLDNNVYSSYYN